MDARKPQYFNDLVNTQKFAARHLVSAVLLKKKTVLKYFRH